RIWYVVKRDDAEAQGREKLGQLLTFFAIVRADDEWVLDVEIQVSEPNRIWRKALISSRAYSAIRTRRNRRCEHRKFAIGLARVGTRDAPLGHIDCLRMHVQWNDPIDLEALAVATHDFYVFWIQ